MPSRHYTFITLDLVEQVFTETVVAFFRDYPDPVPNYQYLDGERGRGQLESALAEPRQTFGGQYLHRSVYDKAAALWRSITLNHPFVDGNKRMGFICCLMFLSFNGYLIIAPQEEVEEMCVSIAAGNPAPAVPVLAGWLRKNTITADKLARFQRAIASNPEYWRLCVEALDNLADRAD